MAAQNNILIMVDRLASALQVPWRRFLYAALVAHPGVGRGTGKAPK
jgi:hypothetical protein